MNTIWQAASTVSSWLFGASTVQAAVKADEVKSVFASLASKEGLQKTFDENLDIALNGNNLRNKKARVSANLAAALDKSDVDSVRREIASRLGQKGILQHLAHTQLDKLVKQRGVIAY